MSNAPRPDPTPAPPGTAGPAWRPALGWLAAAAGLAAGALAWWGTAWFSAAGEAPAPAAGPVAASAATAGAPEFVVRPPPDRVEGALAQAGRVASAPQAPPPDGARHVSRRRDPDGDQTPDVADFINDGAIPTTAEVIARLHQAGVHEGLGAFNSPGTRPPLVGLAVPEDFALPPGYVRHYQATDDGQRIEAVLMFAPDARLSDADGRPIAIPPDRIVPPELAPPGLPIRRITIPPPIHGSGRGD